MVEWKNDDFLKLHTWFHAQLAQKILNGLLFTYLFCKKLVPDCSWLETNELRNWWFGLLSYSRSVLNFSLFPRSDQRRILNLNNEAFDTVPVDGSWEWPTYILHNRTELCRAIVIIVIDCSKNKTQSFLLTPFQVKYLGYSQKNAHSLNITVGNRYSFFAPFYQW